MPQLNTHGSGAVRSYTGANGVVVPSVTEILKVLDGVWMNAFLQRAGKREVDRVLNDAAVLGTKVHKTAEVLAWDRKARVEPEMRPYARAIREFLNTHVRRVIATELSLCSERLGFGGTVDLVCELMDGSLALVDYKSVSGGVTKVHKLQTCAYGMLLREHGYPVKKRLIVKIHKKEDRLGDHYVRAATDHRKDIEVFLACVKVWNFLHGGKLKKAQVRSA